MPNAASTQGAHHIGLTVPDIEKLASSLPKRLASPRLATCPITPPCF